MAWIVSRPSATRVFVMIPLVGPLCGDGAACSRADDLSMGDLERGPHLTTQSVCLSAGFSDSGQAQSAESVPASSVYFGFALAVSRLSSCSRRRAMCSGCSQRLQGSGPRAVRVPQSVRGFCRAGVFRFAVVCGPTRRERALIYAGMAAVSIATVIASASRAGAAWYAELVAILRHRMARRSISPRMAGIVGDLFHRIRKSVSGRWSAGNAVGPDRLAGLYTTRGELLRSSIDMVRERPGMDSPGNVADRVPGYARSDDGLFTPGSQ